MRTNYAVQTILTDSYFQDCFLFIGEGKVRIKYTTHVVSQYLTRFVI